MEKEVVNHIEDKCGGKNGCYFETIIIDITEPFYSNIRTAIIFEICLN